jgi:Tfp pilus assembly protein PilF
MVLRPEHEAARINLALIVRELERLSGEEADCRRAIDSQPANAASHVRLGKVLLALGRADEAVARFREAVSIEPGYADACHHLGLALSRTGNLDEAIACHARAISIEPRFAQAMAGLAAAHYLKGEAQQAIAWNRAALAIEPRQVEANQNLARILLESGEREEAKRHLNQAHRGQSFDIEYASNPARTVLLLWTRNKGNVPTIEFLFPTTINNRINWVIESDQDDQTADLPAYDVVFNAMGDPDLIGNSVGPVRRFAGACAKPLLNPPDQVARTARHQLPPLLDGIDGVYVPRVWRFASSAEWDESLAEQLPVLIRPVDSHGGAGLELARTVNDLARYRDSQRGPVYVCRFIDYRSDDSWFRKYRMIFIDREPHPCHLAISRDWMVHYYTADMESHPWKIEEENVFLRDPEASLGRTNMDALRSIGARIDLEYAGIDFSIMEDKQILVFEANPTMLVHPERIGGPVEHKNVYVFRIQRSFEEMLKRRCQ